MTVIRCTYLRQALYQVFFIICTAIRTCLPYLAMRPHCQASEGDGCDAHNHDQESGLESENCTIGPLIR